MLSDEEETIKIPRKAEGYHQQSPGSAPYRTTKVDPKGSEFTPWSVTSYDRILAQVESLAINGRHGTADLPVTIVLVSLTDG